MPLQQSEKKEKIKTPEQTPPKRQTPASNKRRESIQSKEESITDDSSSIQPAKIDLSASLKPLKIEQKASMEQVKSIFQRNIPEEQNYIDCSCLGGVFIEIFKELKATIENKKVWKLLQEIDDFIPKKLTVKTFLDLFNLPQTKDFITQNEIPLDFTPLKSESMINSSVRYSEKAVNQSSLSIGNKSSGLHSLSSVTNTGLSPSKNNEILKPFSRKDRESISVNQSSLPESRETQSRMSVVEKEGEFGGIDMSSHLLNESSIHKPLGHHHSLSLDTSYDMRTSFDDPNLAINYTIVKWNDLYGGGLGELFRQLMSYSLTPPKPIMGKEVQNVILKEVSAPSTENSLMSSILAYFGFMMKRAVKTYSFSQHKKIEKIIEEKKMLKPIQIQYGPMDLKGNHYVFLLDFKIFSKEGEAKL